MTAPERRRPLPALAFIGVLCLLTGIVWFRVIHRPDGSTQASAKCAAGGTASASPTSPVTTKTTESTKTAKTTRQAAPGTVPVVPHPKKVSVLVLNSTSKNGIATATQKALTKQGFHVTDATNDGAAYGGHGQIKGVGEIRYGPRGLPAATLVHLYLPKSAMRETDASSKLVTVSLGAAYTSIASTKAVRTAMRAQHIRFGTPKRPRTKSPSC